MARSESRVVRRVLGRAVVQVGGRSFVRPGDVPTAFAIGARVRASQLGEALIVRDPGGFPEERWVPWSSVVRDGTRICGASDAAAGRQVIDSLVAPPNPDPFPRPAKLWCVAARRPLPGGRGFDRTADHLAVEAATAEAARERTSAAGYLLTSADVYVIDEEGAKHCALRIPPAPPAGGAEQVIAAGVFLRGAARNYAEVADLDESDPRWEAANHELEVQALAYARAKVGGAKGGA